MKFQKYLRGVQQSSAALRHIDYKSLKVEIKSLCEKVAAGQLTRQSASDGFSRRLEAELTEVACAWEACLWELRERVEELFASADMFLSGDAAHGALCEPLGPMRLLEPLRAWLLFAALADALRRHRLLQVTAVVKIEKKFVKALKVQPRPAFSAPEILRRSALSSPVVHVLCNQLEAAGDAMLKLGLRSPFDRGCEECSDACSICLDGLVDPARLPCGHRFCVHCVLPLFGHPLEAEPAAALLRCPLCRAEGPPAPQALRLDTLLGRLGRRLSPQGEALLAEGLGQTDSEVQSFTAVAVSSLTRLAAHEAAGDEERGAVPVFPAIPHSRSCCGGCSTASSPSTRAWRRESSGSACSSAGAFQGDVEA